MTPEAFLSLSVQERALRLIHDHKNCPAEVLSAAFTTEEFKSLPLLQRLRILGVEPKAEYGSTPAQLLKEAADEIEDLREEHMEVRNVLRDLLLRVHWVVSHPSVVGMFVAQALRSGAQHNLPNWKDAFDSALRLFGREELPQPSYPRPVFGAYKTSDFHNSDAEPVFTGTGEEVSSWINEQEFTGESSYFLAPTKEYFPGNSYEDFCVEARLLWRESNE